MAVECQNVDLPFRIDSSLNKFIAASSLIGRVASMVFPFTLAAMIFLAKPSLIDFAISKAVTPSSYCLQHHPEK
jgi:hypothetical protein